MLFTLRILNLKQHQPVSFLATVSTNQKFCSTNRWHERQINVDTQGGVTNMPKKKKKKRQMLKTDDVDSMQALSLAAILTSFCQPNTKCSVVSSTQIYSNLSRRHHNLAQNPCLDIRRKNIGSSLGAQCAKQKDIYLRGLSCWSEVAGAGDAHGSELRHIH